MHALFSLFKEKKALFASGIALISATMAGNILNFIFSVYLGRTLPLESFGQLALFTSLLYFTSIPLGSYSATLVHKIAYLHGKGEKEQVYAYLRYMFNKSLLFGAGMSILWFVLIPFLDKFFHADSFLSLLFFTPLWFLSVMGSNFSGFLGGTLSFGKKALILLTESVTRLLVAFLLVGVGLVDFIYFSIVVSIMTSVGVGWLFAKKVTDNRTQVTDKSFNSKFFLTSVASNISLIAFLTFDVVLVKHFLDAASAGQYGLLSLIGKMTYFLGSLLIPFIIPLVSHSEGAKKDSKKIFLLLLGISIIFSGCSYIGLGLFGGFFVPLIFGAKAAPIVPLLGTYVLAMAIFTTMQVVVNYFQAKQRYSFVLVGVLIAAFQVIGIWMFHETLAEVVNIMLLTSILNFVSVALLYAGNKKFLKRFKKN